MTVAVLLYTILFRLWTSTLLNGKFLLKKCSVEAVVKVLWTWIIFSRKLFLTNRSWNIWSALSPWNFEYHNVFYFLSLVTESSLTSDLHSGEAIHVVLFGRLDRIFQILFLFSIGIVSTSNLAETSRQWFVIGVMHLMEGRSKTYVILIRSLEGLNRRTMAICLISLEFGAYFGQLSCFKVYIHSGL